MSWSEPTAWHQAAAKLAQSEGRSQFPWLSWSLAFCLYSGVIIWGWLDADPAIRASIPKLMGIIVVGFGSMLCFGWILVRIGRSNTTTIREGGLVHGSRFKKRWIPWSRIEYFYIDEDRMEPWSFRFLTWKIANEEDETFSVIPDSVETSSIVRYLVTNKVEQVVPSDGHKHSSFDPSASTTAPADAH